MEEYTARYQEHVLRLERAVQSLRRKRVSGNGEGADGTLPYLQEVILKYLCNLTFHKALAYLQEVILKYRCNLAFHQALAYLLEVKLKYLCNLAFHKAPVYLQEVKLKYLCNLAFHKPWCICRKSSSSTCAI